jgi:hypothetical protein
MDLPLQEGSKGPTARICADDYLSGPSTQEGDEAGQQEGRRHTMVVGISIYGPTAAVGTGPAIGVLTGVWALNFMQEWRGKQRLTVTTARPSTQPSRPMLTARPSAQPLFNYFNMYSFTY